MTGKEKGVFKEVFKQRKIQENNPGLTKRTVISHTTKRIIQIPPSVYTETQLVEKFAASRCFRAIKIKKGLN